MNIYKMALYLSEKIREMFPSEEIFLREIREIIVNFFNIKYKEVFFIFFNNNTIIESCDFATQSST